MLDTIVENVLPYALMIGVDYDLFWSLNPKSFQPFVKAFQLRQEYDDMVAWLNGMYVKRAIASSLNKEAKYPNHPMMSKPKLVEMPQEVIMERFMRAMNKINNTTGKAVENG